MINEKYKALDQKYLVLDLKNGVVYKIPVIVIALNRSKGLVEIGRYPSIQEAMIKDTIPLFTKKKKEAVTWAKSMDFTYLKNVSAHVIETKPADEKKMFLESKLPLETITDDHLPVAGSIENYIQKARVQHYIDTFEEPVLEQNQECDGGEFHHSDLEGSCLEDYYTEVRQDVVSSFLHYGMYPLKNADELYDRVRFDDSITECIKDEILSIPMAFWEFLHKWLLENIEKDRETWK